MNVVELSDYVSNSKLRVEILTDLLRGPSKTVTELARDYNKHLSHTSRTLSELKKKGLVISTKGESSRERYYKPTKEAYLIFAQMLIK